MNKYIEKYIPIFGMLLGGIVFFIICGYKILNPTFIEWTMEGDAAQHFLGWHFFRSEPWTFPIGVIKSYQYPQGTSVVYTDSIPLLAIPLKLLSPVLSPVFQYHGLWLLLSYALQGYFSSLLLRQITKNQILILLGIVFFLLSPCLLQRATGHEALTGHWIILASLYLYFQVYSFNNRIKWMILLIMASMVHFYLLAMALSIFSGYLLRQMIENYKKSFLSVIKFSTTALVVTLISMWIVGYFVVDVGSSSSEEGFGIYSMNLLAPVNPDSESIMFETYPPEFVFLKSYPLAHEEQYEGFNYLGFGLLLLILISIYAFIRQKNIFSVKIHLPLILVAFVLLAISLSNKITFTNIVLCELNLPHVIDKWSGIIRSSGRMFWPVSYMLMLSAIGIVIKCNSTKKSILLLLIFVCFQVIDFFPVYRSINLNRMLWNTPLKSHLWNNLMEEVEHIVFLPPDPDVINDNVHLSFAFLAATHGKTLNVGYTARYNDKDRAKYSADLLQKFKERKFKSDTLYIIRNGYLYTPTSSSDFNWGILDGFTIIAPRMESVKLKPWPFSIPIDYKKYTINQLIEEFSAPGYAILLSVRDDGFAKIPGDFVKNMKEIGSDIDQLQFRGSYAAIIIDGKLKIEEIDNNGKVEFEYRLPKRRIKIVSAGYECGNNSIININNLPLSINERGFNIVVLKLDDNEVKRYSFDTDEYSNPVSTNE